MNGLRSGPTDDGLEVARFLIAHLGQPKILLVGHSWEPALGVFMLKRNPQLFSAFVGTGQLVNMRRNEECNYPRSSCDSRAATTSSR